MPSWILRGWPDRTTPAPLADDDGCGRTRDAAGGATALRADTAGRDGPDVLASARSKLAIANRTETMVTSTVAMNRDASAARPRAMSNGLGGRDDIVALIRRPSALP